MAGYTDVTQSPFKLYSFKHGNTTIADANSILSVNLDKIIDRVERFAGTSITAVNNPINRISASVTVRFLNPNNIVSHTAAAANVEIKYIDGADTPTTGTLTIGPMRAGSIRFVHDTSGSGYYEQDFVMEGSTLTFTASI